MSPAGPAPTMPTVVEWRVGFADTRLSPFVDGAVARASVLTILQQWASTTKRLLPLGGRSLAPVLNPPAGLR